MEQGRQREHSATDHVRLDAILAQHLCSDSRLKGQRAGFASSRRCAAHRSRPERRSPTSGSRSLQFVPVSTTGARETRVRVTFVAAALVRSRPHARFPHPQLDEWRLLTHHASLEQLLASFDATVQLSPHAHERKEIVWEVQSRHRCKSVRIWLPGHRGGHGRRSISVAVVQVPRFCSCSQDTERFTTNHVAVERQTRLQTRDQSGLGQNFLAQFPVGDLCWPSVFAVVGSSAVQLSDPFY